MKMNDRKTQRSLFLFATELPLTFSSLGRVTSPSATKMCDNHSHSKMQGRTLVGTGTLVEGAKCIKSTDPYLILYYY